MDLATILGIVIAIASLLVANILEGGHTSALLKGSAALIVFGGTIGATMTCFGLDELKSIGSLFKIAFTSQDYTPLKVIDIIVRFAEKARREGLLALEADIAEIDDEFLQKGIQLIVDGTDPELVRDILETELAYIEDRHHKAASIFEAAGGYAPTMGIIGTVMGLVHVLGNLSDPGNLGPAIATAFIATFYGVASANIIYLPIAAKLKNKSAREILVRELMMEGILSIQAGENPHIVKEKLKAFLSPNQRKEMGEGGSEG